MNHDDTQHLLLSCLGNVSASLSLLLQLLAFEDPSVVSVKLQLHHPLATVVEWVQEDLKECTKQALRQLQHFARVYMHPPKCYHRISRWYLSRFLLNQQQASPRVGKVCTSDLDEVSMQIGKVCTEDVLSRMESKVRCDLACSRKISVHSFPQRNNNVKGATSPLSWRETFKGRRGGASSFTACLDIDLGDDHGCVLFRNTWRKIY